MPVSLAIKLSTPKPKDPRSGLRPDEFVMHDETALKIKKRSYFIPSAERKWIRIYLPPIPGDIITDRYLERVANLPSHNPTKVNIELIRRE